MAKNPSACCGIEMNCCTGTTMPEVPTATITNGQNCACAGQEIQLAWNDATSKWEGTGPFGSCGRDITLKFSCGAGGPSDCTLFSLTLSFSDACRGEITVSPTAGCACDPLNVVFSAAVDPCCGVQGPQVIAITVTE